MKRDNDLLRELLIEFEAQKSWQIFVHPHLGMTELEITREHHVQLLSDAGFLLEMGDSLYRMTNSGHDYLDAIRNDGIWKKTKDGAASVGGVTLGIMKEIAVAYIKQQVSEKLGITIG